MTRALLDVPRCLKVETSYVGPPRVLITPRTRRNAWADASPSGGTAAYRRQAVLECLDTAAVLREYREPLEGETWLTPAASERRLLAQVNAIIALGPQALTQVAALSIDPEVPDPGRVFAVLLILGCVEGPDWLAQARDIFLAATLRNPAEAAAAVEALSLCPNPELAMDLAPLLGHEQARVRASTTRVLAFHGALSEDAWDDAIHDRDPSVVAAAACAPLRGYDRGVCERALQPLLARRDAEALVRLAMRAGLGLRLGAAHDCAVRIVRSDHPYWGDAANCLAMFGYLADASRIREVLAGAHPLEGVDAAVILGSIELEPDLLDLLARDDCTPEASIEIKQALAGITGLAFDTAPDAAESRRLWAQGASNFESRVRYRRGRPLSLESLLQSLRAGPGSRDARQRAYLEMLAATESRVPRFSPYDFVGVQAESLRRIEHWLADLQSRRPTSTNLH